MTDLEEEIKDFIKKNFEPVEDKPGYVWFSRRNFQIISVENLSKSLKDWLTKERESEV